MRQEVNSLERKVRLLEVACSESWELISQRLNSMLGDSVGALSDRLTDLEQTVQSRRTTPAAEANASQVPTETVVTVEQTFTHEVERLTDECERSISGQCDLLDYFDERKQKSMARQLTGLKSFAKHVEKFLEQHTSGGATAPFGRFGLAGHERERYTATSEQTPGASSSSTRPPPYVLMPEPPAAPAPPIPSDAGPTFDPQPSSTTHSSTVRSEVRAGAIRIDITDPEQWSAGDTAILSNQESKQANDIGSLIFETSIQHDYEAGVEVRSLRSGIA